MATAEEESDVDSQLTDTAETEAQPVPQLRTKSRLWDYYSVGSPQDKKAKCSVCNAMIARGGSTIRSFTTTNLRNHLRCVHCVEYKELEKKEKEQQDKKRKMQAEESASTSSELKKAYHQTKISDAMMTHSPWGPTDPRRRAQNKLLVELVAIDLEPFSIVDHIGFRRYTYGLEPRYTLPDRTQLSRTEIPALYNKVVDKIKQEHLDKETALAFTTDIWSSSHGGNSLMSLTCHWVNEKFEKRNCVLNASSLPGSHTGDAIAAEIQRMYTQWDIPKEHILVIVRDNAANAVRGCELTGLNHLGCFIHTLQLVVKDGMGTQRAINDMLAVARKIVGHFNHSPLAYHRLHRIQSKHGLPEHCLIQDVSTRWNSTFYMLERVLEQKLALVEYCTEYDIPVMTPNQWSLAQTLVQNLQRFEYFTREASEAKASASMIIPTVSLLSRALASHKNDRGIQTMTDEMLTSLRRRYSDIGQINC